MSRKIFTVVCFAFIVLSLLWSGSASAQVKVLKNGRPWEVDSSTIPQPRDPGSRSEEPGTGRLIGDPQHDYSVRNGSVHGNPEPNAIQNPGPESPAMTDLFILTLRRSLMRLTF
jgi:hypothetical protein